MSDPPINALTGQPTAGHTESQITLRAVDPALVNHWNGLDDDVPITLSKGELDRLLGVLRDTMESVMLGQLASAAAINREFDVANTHLRSYRDKITAAFEGYVSLVEDIMRSIPGAPK